jgi:hypothetical protein
MRKIGFTERQMLVMSLLRIDSYADYPPGRTVSPPPKVSSRRARARRAAASAFFWHRLEMKTAGSNRHGE